MIYFLKSSDTGFSSNEELIPDITLAKVIHSDTADANHIDNTPSEIEIANLKSVLLNCVQPIQEHFNKTMTITSGFRSEALNTKVGGVPGSQHTTGQAIDIDMGPETNKEILIWAKSNIDFDQLIDEKPDANGDPSWVHVSYVSKEANRHEVLKLY